MQRVEFRGRPVQGRRRAILGRLQGILGYLCGFLGLCSKPYAASWAPRRATKVVLPGDALGALWSRFRGLLKYSGDRIGLCRAFG